MDIVEYAENLALLLTSLTGIVLSIADLFDFLRFMGDHTPMLIVLLLSLVLGSLTLILHRFKKLHEDVRGLLEEERLEHLNTIHELVDPKLREVLNDDYFDDVLSFLRRAVHKHEVEMNDEARFLHYFANTLRVYSKATFLIASTSATTLLWKDSTIEAMSRFIQDGGTIRLLLFFKDAEDLNRPEVKMAISRLQHKGIHVSTTHHAVVHSKQKKNFIVESTNQIAWEFKLDEKGTIVTSMVMTDEHGTKTLHTAFDRLQQTALPVRKGLKLRP
ncbi:MAG: hypothetical protein H0U76_17780 [Ktedonobacteraceae bacterium]|nr:hypothetical protein [Ktedonobacteraceae bacterium]